MRHVYLVAAIFVAWRRVLLLGESARIYFDDVKKPSKVTQP